MLQFGTNSTNYTTQRIEKGDKHRNGSIVLYRNVDLTSLAPANINASSPKRWHLYKPLEQNCTQYFNTLCIASQYVLKMKL